MELASRLAGEPWSDHPACVHPVLAAVARGVNDAVADACRARLVSLVPRLIGTAAAGPARDQRSDLGRCARITIRCAAAALSRTSVLGPEMESARRTAQAVLARREGLVDRGGSRSIGLAARVSVAVLDRAGLLDRIYPGTAVRQVTQAVALLRMQQCDRLLVRLLEDCVSDWTDSPPDRQLAQAQ
jgi:hypothetical protein